MNRGEDQQTTEDQRTTEEMSAAFSLSHRRGDLFLCDASRALAHCVSADLAMGAGIATQFRVRFGGIPVLRAQHVAEGGVAVLQTGSRIVYYLVTKARYWEKPTLEALKASLTAMRAECVARGTKTLAIPKIGCGLDRLKWADVEAALRAIFARSGVNIEVWSL